MIRVLVADGSPIARMQWTALLHAAPDLRVVGQARHARDALRLCRQLRPDLVLVDERLPAAGGVAATREIMAEVPTPVVLVVDAERAGEESGAVMLLPRPPLAGAPGDASVREPLLASLRAMATVRVVRRWNGVPTPPAATPPPAASSHRARKIRLVAIAASTGGPKMLQRLFDDLGPRFPVPVVVVQHITHGFVGGLVRWLDASSAPRVSVAQEGELLRPGRIYFAPDDLHLGVTPELRVALSAADPIGGFRPAADHLFASVARALGSSAAGVILTGMGRDGVAGLAEIAAAGGTVLAQDEESSVVFGMPREALRAGVVSRTIAAGELGACLSTLIRNPAYA
jgi:two-component system chemotaxis response regulator CheB